MKKQKTFILMLLLSAAVVSCQKQFLDTKPSKSLLVPETLADFRALLDNLSVFNRSPGLTEVADGDFYTTDAGWKTWTNNQERTSYLWQADIFGVEKGFDWNAAYQQVFYANVVLDGLTQNKIPASADRDAVEGTALFSRGWAFYHLLQMFGPAYQPQAAATALGIPIRLDPDVTKLVPRSSLSAGYGQVLADLGRARRLLPSTTSAKSRPGTVTALAMLARIHLAMGNYAQAGAYADSALQLNGKLLDYNNLSTTAARPFPQSLPNGNDEVVYHDAMASYSFNAATSVFYCDSVLYRSYNSNDLRKVLLFKDNGLGKINFKGSYTGSSLLFAGLANDELYLIRAECNARNGQAAAALADLNNLLVKRWKKGTFVPYTGTDAQSILMLILAERRKEMVGRNMRWYDLKRLNLNQSTAVTLIRTLNGAAYTLEPGSPRYTYPITPDELLANPLVQNDR
ncbi:RagB/SusD family nutrient uptake outer membrane protein [Mucilaginibacter agri]|uniref:RagB/SusD family nutrient uptake outer membrane protein n=1 Tax=Mucilaginibacter agri TaxID=2695265 RepID=A0A966DT97_9SPHI|nr:RagB/SusD family nutrient uptake outer membrane protein [Mucilaginibacter agri]NCD69097.1 RagB/SusD family nutrient uptake outer membrane protein [Mucilaginibacter agri]